MGRGHETDSPPRGDGALGGMNLSRCNYTSKVAHLRIYRQTHAEKTRGNLSASPAVMCRRPAPSKHRGARRRAGHRGEITILEAPPLLPLTD